MSERASDSGTTRTMPAKSGLRLGNVIVLDIAKAVYRGQGLGRHQGQVVFVPRAVPGDRVRIRIEQVIVEAPGRRAAPCPLFDHFGGCAYQDYDYPGQLALKEAVPRTRRSLISRMCCGPVRQHPPTKVAPRPCHSSAACAKSMASPAGSQTLLPAS